MIARSQAGYYSGITVNPRPTLSGNATTAQVLTGRTFYNNSYTKRTGTMANRGAVTNTITTQGGSYTIPSGYHSGSGKVTASFSNLSAGNIKSGVNIGGVVGDFPTLNNGTGTLYHKDQLNYEGTEVSFTKPTSLSLIHMICSSYTVMIIAKGTKYIGYMTLEGSVFPFYTLANIPYYASIKDVVVEDTRITCTKSKNNYFNYIILTL